MTTHVTTGGSKDPRPAYPSAAPTARTTEREPRTYTAGQKKLGGLAGWVDERTGAGKGIGYLMKKVFPDHWSFMLGEVAMYSMIICLLTGVFLTFWFVPSQGLITYNGSYVPLKGVEMSEAYASTLDISFDIRGGLLIRQIHHWAALMFIVAVSVHMMRVFFTGAFRKPRELNWVIGSVLAMLAIVEGFAGYSLPDDLLSGTGIRAMNGFMLSAPVIGSYLTYFVFGGDFPGEDIIPRLYSAHVLLIPGLLIALFTAHIVLVAVQKHTQFPGPGRTNNNVVGFPVMPVYAAKAGGFFFIVFGVLALIASLFQINAIWGYGPYDPSPVTAGSQPDWYMWFTDGALRLLPGFLEFEALGFTWSFNIFTGSLLLLPLVYVALGVYPFIEAFATGDKREHHLLDRPRNAPVRTGIGVATITAYTLFAIACTNDIIAIKMHMSINDITIALRILVFVLPPIMFWVTKRICQSLQQADRETVLHGRESGRLVRTAGGRFYEAHEPLDEYTRWKLVGYETPQPLQLDSGVDRNGVPSPTAKHAKLRSRMSNFYYGSTVQAVTPAELEAAHHHGQEHEAIEATEETTSDRHIGADTRS